MKWSFVGVVLGIWLTTGAAFAQSTLSVQGFGYPTGGLSTRSLTTGGATSEVDPVSALNPAALATWGAAGLAAQLLPESRTVRGPSQSGATSVVRFPLYSAGIHVSPQTRLGVSSSTLLDQSWSTRSQSTQVVNGQTVESTSTRRNLGAMNDLRLGFSYSASSTFHAGVGLHLISGSNVLTVATDFSAGDISDINLRDELGYSGSAFSAGIVWEPISAIRLGASARKGGSLNMRRGDVDVASATVPDRMGASLVFAGFPGALMALRYEQVSFSQMNGLGSEDLRARDTGDVGVGVELAGPGILQNPSIIRLGLRRRGLPFDAIGAKVMETSYSAGMGASFAGDRAMIDIGVLRIFRTNSSAYRESAWAFATGILIRP